MLYIIATPIGNLEDVTLRALRLLKEVDYILAEDTRNTRKLLHHFSIRTKTISFHEHSRDIDYKKVLKLLLEGKKIALVTDAGTPGISDPGARLVSFIRKSAPEVEIAAVPGPSALSAAISVAGLPTTKSFFAGFAPHKKGRQTFFKNISEKLDDETAFIFFESPHRLLKAIESLKENCPNKKIALVKEMTKIHEEVISGTPLEVSEFLDKNPDKVKGEFVVIVY